MNQNLNFRSQLQQSQKNKIKILVINDLYPPNSIGGYEHRCKDTVEWLKIKEYEVRVLTTKSEFDVELPENVFPVFRSNLDESIKNESPGARCLRMIRENWALEKQTKDFNPHLIYTWNLEFFSNTLIYHIHQLGFPILRDVSSPWLLRYYDRPGDWIRFWNRKSVRKIIRLLKPMFKKALPRLSKGLVSTEFASIKSDITYFTANWFREKHIHQGVETSEAKVIHTGIALEDFDYTPPEPPDPGVPVKFLFLGRISPDKNIEVLIQGLAILQGKFDYQLDIVGKAKSEEYQSAIQKLILELEQDAFISLKPYVPRKKVAALMSKYHFLLFPSHQEIFSRLLFEAMAVGLPVIAAASGGNLEVIENEATGYLFDQSEPASLADFVKKAAAQKMQYEEVQKNGRRLVEDKFTINHFLENVEEELNLLLGSHRDSR